MHAICSLDVCTHHGLSSHAVVVLCRSGKPCSAALMHSLFQLLSSSKSLKVSQTLLHVCYGVQVL